VTSASAVASANAAPVSRWCSVAASVKQNSANATKPLTRPRSSVSSSSAPRWAWVKVASTVAMIGNGASSPLSCGPSQPETAVSVSTSASAHAARTGRSQRGGEACSRRSRPARGSAASPAATATPASASAPPTGSDSSLNTAVPAANASHPASMLAPQNTRGARRP